MSFYNIFKEYEFFNFEDFFNEITDNKVLKSINKQNPNTYDFLTLISPKAENHLEMMAIKSKEITTRLHGKSIVLYSPLYLSNYCVNQCTYCGFQIKNDIERKVLAIDEIEKEAEIIAETGIKHILILTGESRVKTPLSYIIESIRLLKKYFEMISIEIYPLEESEYHELIKEGLAGLTIYQEVYNETTYKSLHIKGPKTNYLYRLDCPERACKAGIDSLNIGSLLGLDNCRSEAFYLGLHTKYLSKKYPSVELGISLPRIRPQTGGFLPHQIVSDKTFVQLLLAFRICFPQIGITVSTRENSFLRDNIMGLGVTKMSAGSVTKVGGYANKQIEKGQFDISDNRSVNELKNKIYEKGYQPVFKDWVRSSYE